MQTTTRSSRPLTLAALILLLSVILAAAGCKDRTAGATNQNDSPTPAPAGPLTLEMPAAGAYTGAYVDFGEGEAQVTYDALTDFAAMTGKPLAVVAFGNFWGDGAFPKKSVQIISSYGAVPLLFWSPWDKPYSEGRGPDRFNLNAIVAGKWDGYIDSWADAAREYGKPLLVTWGLEMNGNWFPWSGLFYGGGKKSREQKNGTGAAQGPELYKQAYRHVVDRVRRRGVTNILWGFHANNQSIPHSQWNSMASYYPGAEYVDWLGLSVYGKMQRQFKWTGFHEQMATAYQEICRLDPIKPVFVAEWGVGEFPPGDKGAFLTEGLKSMAGDYPRVRLAVYWHERWENEDGSYSNLRVNSTPRALEAYRAGIAAPYWIGRPLFRPRPAEGQTTR